MSHKLLMSHHIPTETVVDNYLLFGHPNDFRELSNCIMLEKPSIPVNIMTGYRWG